MRLALVFTILATGAVAQDCPTAADLETGVRLTRTDPAFALLFRKTDGVLSGFAPMPDGTAIPIAEVAETDVATLINGPAVGARYVYDTPLQSLDDFQRQRSWSSRFSVNDGSETIASGEMTLDLTGLGEIDLGGCTYAVWRIAKQTRLDDGAVIRAEDAFSPELGLTLNSIQLDAQGTPMGDLTFDRITAE